MAISCREIFIFSVLILLAGCTQNHEVSKLKNQVIELKQTLGTLADQAFILERQNRLNRNSADGVYLLPNASNAARLNSDIGELSVSLNNLKNDGNGSQATLYIRLLSGKFLSGFTATLEWGRLDNTTGIPLKKGSHSQQLQSNYTLLPKTEQVFKLRLSEIPLEQLGYIRLHNIVPLSSSTVIQ